jgi:hypothetical protein
MRRDDSAVEKEVAVSDFEVSTPSRLDFLDGGIMRKRTGNSTFLPYRPRRSYAARGDASVGTIERKLAEAFNLPEGSVCIRLPNRRKARADKQIWRLRREWER